MDIWQFSRSAIIAFCIFWLAVGFIAGL